MRALLLHGKPAAGVSLPLACDALDRSCTSYLILRKFHVAVQLSHLPNPRIRLPQVLQPLMLRASVLDRSPRLRWLILGQILRNNPAAAAFSSQLYTLPPHTAFLCAATIDVVGERAGQDSQIAPDSTLDNFVGQQVAAGLATASVVVLGHIINVALE